MSTAPTLVPFEPVNPIEAEDAITILENLLEDVKSGECRAIMVGSFYGPHSVRTQVSLGIMSDRYRACALAGMLHHDAIESLREDREPL